MQLTELIHYRCHFVSGWKNTGNWILSCEPISPSSAIFSLSSEPALCDIFAGLLHHHLSNVAPRSAYRLGYSHCPPVSKGFSERL
jgi:hypothetical protein